MGYDMLKPPAGTMIKEGHPLAKGLVGHWEFNEGPGSSIVRDLSRNKNDGTMTNFDGYTLGPEETTNGSFTSWAADNPTGWSVNEVGDATSNVTENPANSCQFLRTTPNCWITQASVLEVGKLFKVVIVASSVVSGALSVGDNSSSTKFGVLNSSGTTTFVATAGDPTFTIIAQNNTDITIDSVSVKEITSSSDWVPGR